MAIEELNVIVKAETNRARRDFKKFDRQIDKTAKTAKSFASKAADVGRQLLPLGLAGGVVAGAIGGFRALSRTITNSLNVFAEQEQAEASLQAAIEATGKKASISADALIDYAGELQKVTLFGDEATIAATGVLQSLADLDQEGLQQILPGLQDFSTALGVDLQTAASLIGKTLGSSTNALSRYGIVIDATASKSDKLSEITTQLEEKFGGASEAAANTATGAMTQLQNAIGDLQEESGRFIANGLEPFARGLTDIVSNITSTISASNRLSGTWAVVGEDAEEAASSIDEFISGQKSASKQAAELRKELDDSLVPVQYLIEDFEKLAGDEKVRAINEEIADLRRQVEGLGDEDLVLGLGEFFNDERVAATAKTIKDVLIPQLVNFRDSIGEIKFEELTDRGKIARVEQELAQTFAFIDSQAEKYGDTVDATQLKNKVFGEALSRLAKYDFREYGDGVLYLKRLFSDELNPAIEDGTEETETQSERMTVAQAKLQQQFAETARFAEIDRKKVDELGGSLGIAQTETGNLTEEMKEAERQAKKFREEMEVLAATLINDIGNAIREGDSSGLAESIGGALGGAVGMLAGGPIGAALGSQLGALWGQTMGKAFQSPEFLQEAEEAMAQMGSTLSSIISDGGTLQEFANALDQQMREIVVEQAVKAFALEKDLKKLGRKIARAMRDGVIDASEESDINALKSKISRKAEMIQRGTMGVYEDLGITPSSPDTSNEQAAPQPYIGPVQTAGAPGRVVNNYVTVQGSVMREDEITDSIFADANRRGIA
jgi:hypothetical protein